MPRKETDMPPAVVREMLDRLEKLDPVLARLKRKHKGSPYDETVDCPVCNHSATLRVRYQNPRAAIIVCSTKNCVRILS